MHKTFWSSMISAAARRVFIWLAQTSSKGMPDRLANIFFDTLFLLLFHLSSLSIALPCLSLTLLLYIMCNFIFNIFIERVFSFFISWHFISSISCIMVIGVSAVITKIANSVILFALSQISLAFASIFSIVIITSWNLIFCIVFKMSFFWFLFSSNFFCVIKIIYVL